MGAAQSAIFTVIAERNNPSAWIIGLNIDLWSIIYGVSIMNNLSHERYVFVKKYYVYQIIKF